MGRFIEYAIIFLVIVVLQLFIFSKIHIAGYATVNILPLFVMLLPLEMERWRVLLFSALIGVVMDALTGLPALNTISLTAIGYLRQMLINLFIGVKDGTKRGVISVHTQSSGRVAIFIFVMVVIQNIIYFTFEIFSLSDILFALLKIVSASLSSMIFIYLLHLPLFARQDQI